MTGMAIMRAAKCVFLSFFNMKGEDNENDNTIPYFNNIYMLHVNQPLGFARQSNH